MDEKREIVDAVFIRLNEGKSIANDVKVCFSDLDKLLSNLRKVSSACGDRKSKLLIGDCTRRVSEIYELLEDVVDIES